jgi:hypothetical protein
VKRELITRWSNPAKYNITEAGAALAARIIQVEQQAAPPATNRDPPIRPTNRNNSSSTNRMGATVAASANRNSARAGMSSAQRVDQQQKTPPLATGTSASANWANFELSPSIDLGSDSFLDDVIIPPPSTSAAQQQPPAVASVQAADGALSGEEEPADEDLPLALRLQRQLIRAARISESVARTDTHHPAFRLVPALELKICLKEIKYGSSSFFLNTTAEEILPCWIQYVCCRIKNLNKIRQYRYCSSGTKSEIYRYGTVIANMLI